MHLRRHIERVKGLIIMKKMKKVLSGIRGFTLIELIVAMTITSIILAPLLYLYYDTQIDYMAARRKIDVQYAMRKSMNSILEDCRAVQTQYVHRDFTKTEADDATKYPAMETLNGLMAFRYDDAGYTSGVKQVTYGVVNNKLYKVTGDYMVLNPVPNITGGIEIFDGDELRGEIPIGGFTINKYSTNPADPTYITKINNNVVEQYDTFNVAMTFNPKKIGRIEIAPVTVTSGLVPRFNMDIR